MVELLEGLCTTRAIRRLRPDPIPEDDLATMLFGATRAPSGSNRQRFCFIVLRDQPEATAAKALLGEAARSMWGTKRVTDSYDEGSGADTLSPKARQARTMERFVDRFEEIPVVVLVGLRRHRDPSPLEGASVYPACQNLLLSARALGYGGVMVTFQAMVDRELRDTLGVPDEVALSACIALGVPEGNHGPVRRRPLAEFVHDGAWGVEAPWAVDPPGTRHTSAGPPTR
jgi:nitroreductase